jgi:hypothetical protein
VEIFRPVFSNLFRRQITVFPPDSYSRYRASLGCLENDWAFRPQHKVVSSEFRPRKRDELKICRKQIAVAGVYVKSSFRILFERH